MVKFMKQRQDLWHHHPYGSQTKHSYSTTCVWFSFRPFLPTYTLLSLFSFSLGKVGGGSRRWQNFVSSRCWTQHHSSSGWRLELVSVFVSTTPPPLSPRSTLSFCSSLIALCSSAFPLENPARGIYREDNVQRSSLHSFYISVFSLTNSVEYGYFSRRWVLHVFISLLWMHFLFVFKLWGVTRAAQIQPRFTTFWSVAQSFWYFCPQISVSVGLPEWLKPDV